ncbi:MASE1 domain-containing protein [Terasakiella sp. A23]|uniref:MASE1 domain-containing protein n=1 Tax=Terasakiella sp. FCG-A23 TaxID=3080561 RepID=UPI0029529E75|nr:MASE1 domain-containing protein [Terasakiella sp. A23]MDV7340074.1 MASE1 domain-containing protein [Terasakiella sp. A23]
MNQAFHDMPDTQKTIVRILVLAALYYVSGKVGLRLSLAHANVTLIWPPTGFALAFMMLFGYRMWVGAAIGAFLVNITTDISFGAVFGITLGNTAMALCGTYLLRQNNFKADFSRMQDIPAFLFLGAFCSSLVSASVGSSSLLISGAIPSSIFSTVLTDWWLGDAMGVMIVAPFTMILLYTPLNQPWALQKEMVNSLQGGLLAVLSGLLIFSGWAEIKGILNLLLLVPLPIIIWCAYRYGVTGVATGVIGLSSVALVGTSNGYGPFAGEDVHFAFVLFFAYIVVHSIIGLLMASALRERARSQQRIEELEAKFDHLTRSVPDIVVVLNEHENCVYAFSGQEEHIRHLTNKPLDEILDLDLNQNVYRAIQAARTSRTVQLCEVILKWKDRQLLYSLRIAPAEDHIGHERLALYFRLKQD